MIDKKFFILSLFFIFLLSISVVSAEDSADSIVLEDQDENIDLNEENNNLELSTPDSTPDDLCDDGDNADLDATNLENIETDDVVSNEPDCDEIAVEDESALNSKTKNLLKASYRNVYVESVSQKYNYGKYLYLGWEGYFSGYFKVYDSDWYCVHSEYIYGSDRNLEWSLDNLGVGTYKAALVTSDDYWADYGTIKITKSSSVVGVKALKTKNGIIYFGAVVKDRYNNFFYNGGKVRFLINGRYYYATLKDGIAIIKFKVPRKVKRYTCQATFLGGSNVYASSRTFKFTVKRHKVYKYKYKTIYRNFYITRYAHIVSPMLKPFERNGWHLVKSWYGKKSYNGGSFGTFWDIYGKFKKRVLVKRATIAYY